MLLALGQQKLCPVEVKTIAADAFKTLLAPLAEHRWRTNLYLRIMAESTQPGASLVNTAKATVLYITKGGYGCSDPQLATWGLKEKFSPFKEYEVLRDDSDTDEIMMRAKLVKDFRAGKIGMPTGICATALSKRALTCSFKGVCFSGDHPPVQAWPEEKP